MPLPLLHLGYLAIRQVSKPLAAYIKQEAKTHPLLRSYILLPPAQLYHRLDVRLKLWQHNLGIQPTTVKPLNEEMAVEVAADMLGELIIFSIASSLVIFEFLRQRRNNELKQSLQNKRLEELEVMELRLGERLAENRVIIARISDLVGATTRVPLGGEILPSHLSHEGGGKISEKGGMTMGSVMEKGMKQVVKGGEMSA